jgi:hypothetical protein
VRAALHIVGHLNCSNFWSKPAGDHQNVKYFSSHGSGDPLCTDLELESRLEMAAYDSPGGLMFLAIGYQYPEV